MCSDVKTAAAAYVERHYSEIMNRLQNDGYFVCEEFESVTRPVARTLPDILNERLDFSNEDSLTCVERMIPDEGDCYLIIKNNMIDDAKKITEILTNFYRNHKTGNKHE